jgi:phage replication O-like protein O
MTLQKFFVMSFGNSANHSLIKRMAHTTIPSEDVLREEKQVMEGGFTKVPHKLLDFFCRTRIPGEVRQVVDVVLRKTLGYQKKWDRISLSQFQAATGLNKGNAHRALKTAIERGYIMKAGTGRNIKYALGVFRSDNTRIVKNDNPGTLNVVRSDDVNIVNSDEHNINIDTPHKETFKDSPYRLADLLFHEITTNNPKSTFNKFSPEKAESTKQGWCKGFDLLLRKDGQNEADISKVILWACRHDFWKSNILSAGSLRAKWNKLTAQMPATSKDVDRGKISAPGSSSSEGTPREKNAPRQKPWIESRFDNTWSREREDGTKEVLTDEEFQERRRLAEQGTDAVNGLVDKALLQLSRPAKASGETV